MTRFSLLALVVCMLALGGCIAPQGTRAEQLGAVAWEFQDGSETVRELAQIYSATDPRLQSSLDHIADGMNSIAAGLEAAASGTVDGGTVVDQIDALLKFTAATTWSDDPGVQANVQASVAISRALLRRAAHMLDAGRAGE